MLPTSASILPDELRARAERFFGCDFSNIHIHIDHMAARLGAIAVTRGAAIHLSPWAARLPRARLDEIIGHELAHVVQQRQGRVPVRRHIHGMAVNDDSALEAEASELGWLFARHATGPERPGDAGRQARPCHPEQSPVAQCAVALSGMPLDSTDALSPRARTVLELIQSGPQWLDWAIHSPAVNLSFADELQLLSGIQSGLHASSLLNLPEIGLLVSPIKLMTLEAHELDTLAQRESGKEGSVVTLQAKQIIAKHQLLTRDDLSGGTQFLADTGVAGAPIFQAMSLNDLISLYNLVQTSQSEVAKRQDLQNEAAAFALTLARTPAEFVDYYQIYLITAVKNDVLDQGAAAQRSSLAGRTVTTLAPSLYGALASPQVLRPLGPIELTRVIKAWIARGQTLGFLCLSTGMRQILQYTSFAGKPDPSAAKLASAYIAGAQNFITSNEPRSAWIAQDGVSCLYIIEADDRRAELMLDELGAITLYGFYVKADEKEISQPSQGSAAAPLPATPQPSERADANTATTAS
jgi:hypothetical protein